MTKNKGEVCALCPFPFFWKQVYFSTESKPVQSGNEIRRPHMSTVRLEHVYKKYPNGFEAVKDFNLDIADKEFVIFVGPFSRTMPCIPI